MKLIEEMREIAERMNEAGLHWERDRLLNWADRLECATVLVAVPEGEALAAEDASTRDITFIMRGGKVYMAEPHLWDWVDLEGRNPQLNDDIFVQPVRLVPIAEAEL